MCGRGAACRQVIQETGKRDRKHDTHYVHLSSIGGSRKVDGRLYAFEADNVIIMAWARLYYRKNV